jgi:hypothetical protein
VATVVPGSGGQRSGPWSELSSPGRSRGLGFRPVLRARAVCYRDARVLAFAWFLHDLLLVCRCAICLGFV